MKAKKEWLVGLRPDYKGPGSRLNEVDTGCPVTGQENLSRGQSRGKNQAWARPVGRWCGKRPEAGSAVKPFQVQAGPEPCGPSKQTACEEPRRVQREKPTLMCEIRNQDTPVITSPGDWVRSGRPSKPGSRSWFGDVGLRWEMAVVFRQVWFYGPVGSHWRHWIYASGLDDGQGWEPRQRRDQWRGESEPSACVVTTGCDFSPALLSSAHRHSCNRCNFRGVRNGCMYLLISMLSVCFITTLKIRYKPGWTHWFGSWLSSLTNLLVEKGLGGSESLGTISSLR